MPAASPPADTVTVEGSHPMLAPVKPIFAAGNRTMWSLTRRTAIRVTTIIAVLALSACGGGSESFEPPDPDPDPPPSGEPASIAVQQAFTQLSFSQPLAMLQAPGDDTAWYVVERPGHIRVFPNATDASIADVDIFANLTGRVNSGPGEAGLLGMAFHPDFAANGEVFLSYTRGTNLESVISRFEVDSSTGNLDVDSEEVLLTIEQPQGNHNGGNIAFGPDGFLYIGFGDGGGSGDPQGNGQNTTTCMGPSCA
jgi:glucose/arabinose dehydrogenase